MLKDPQTLMRLFVLQSFFDVFDWEECGHVECAQLMAALPPQEQPQNKLAQMFRKRFGEQQSGSSVSREHFVLWLDQIMPKPSMVRSEPHLPSLSSVSPQSLSLSSVSPQSFMLTLILKQNAS